MKSPSIGGEKEGLLEEQANENAPVKKQGILERGDLLKYGSLGFLILQNSSHVLLLRYSRVVGGECSQYVVSIATCPAGRRRSAVVARLHSPHPWRLPRFSQHLREAHPPPRRRLSPCSSLSCSKASSA